MVSKTLLTGVLTLKLRVASLTILCLILVATASAQLYDNGPINGSTDAWTINSGYIVSDSLRCCKSGTYSPSGGPTMTGFEFGAWEFPGDVMTSVDWSLTSAENGGTLFGSGTTQVMDQFISSNQFGYNIDHITVSGLNVSLTGGQSYWLNLQNAVVPSGDPVYWDENSGTGCGGTGNGANCPSSASESAVGTIPSEAFTIDGTNNGTTPEPGSVLLFASGLLGVAGMLRRKLRR